MAKLGSKLKTPVGKCYICQESDATVSDGIGGKLCQPCLDRIEGALKGNALRGGYKPHKR